MCAEAELDEILHQMADSYKSVYGKSLVKVILYGSYARGDYQTDSDVDIIAVVRGTRADLQEKLKRIWDKSSELELEYETIISPTVIPLDEFEKYKEDLPYYRNIKNEGVDIVA